MFPYKVSALWAFLAALSSVATSAPAASASAESPYSDQAEDDHDVSALLQTMMRPPAKREDALPDDGEDCEGAKEAGWPLVDEFASLFQMPETTVQSRQTAAEDAVAALENATGVSARRPVSSDGALDDDRSVLPQDEYSVLMQKRGPAGAAAQVVRRSEKAVADSAAESTLAASATKHAASPPAGEAATTALAVSAPADSATETVEVDAAQTSSSLVENATVEALAVSKGTDSTTEKTTAAEVAALTVGKGTDSATENLTALAASARATPPLASDLVSGTPVAAAGALPPLAAVEAVGNKSYRNFPGQPQATASAAAMLATPPLPASIPATSNETRSAKSGSTFVADAVASAGQKFDNQSSETGASDAESLFQMITGKKLHTVARVGADPKALQLAIGAAFLVFAAAVIAAVMLWTTFKRMGRGDAHTVQLKELSSLPSPPMTAEPLSPRLPAAGISFVFPLDRIASCRKSAIDFEVSTGDGSLRACLYRSHVRGPWERVELMEEADSGSRPMYLSCSRPAPGPCIDSRGQSLSIGHSQSTDAGHKEGACANGSSSPSSESKEQGTKPHFLIYQRTRNLVASLTPGGEDPDSTSDLVLRFGKAPVALAVAHLDFGGGAVDIKAHLGGRLASAHGRCGPRGEQDGGQLAFATTFDGGSDGAQMQVDVRPRSSPSAPLEEAAVVFLGVFAAVAMRPQVAADEEGGAGGAGVGPPCPALVSTPNMSERMLGMVSAATASATSQHGTSGLKALEPSAPRLRGAGTSFVVPLSQILRCSRETLAFDIPMRAGLWPLQARLYRSSPAAAWARVELTVDIAAAADMPPLLTCGRPTSACEPGSTASAGNERGLLVHDGASNLVATISENQPGSWTLRRPGKTALDIRARIPCCLVTVSQQEEQIALATGLARALPAKAVLDRRDPEAHMQVDVQPGCDSPDAVMLLMATLASIVFQAGSYSKGKSSGLLHV